MQNFVMSYSTQKSLQIRKLKILKVFSDLIESEEIRVLKFFQCSLKFYFIACNNFSWDLLILPVFGIESHSIQLKINQLKFFAI